MKTITLVVRGILIATLGCLLASSSRAEVHVARFDPPLSVSAFSAPLPGLAWNTTAFDFDLDGQTDFRLTYGEGMMTAYFNSPTRFASKVHHPVLIGAHDMVGAVPLGWVIGSNIISSGLTADSYTWSAGDTNTDNLPELLGDHQEGVIFAQLAIASQVGPITPNRVIIPSFPTGDVTGQEGVMALEFYIGSERHYGYIHFNFKTGTGGVIYGWAYETEPDVPIQAMPLLPGEKLKNRKILFEPLGKPQEHER